jgi:hypothetical protein
MWRMLVGNQRRDEFDIIINDFLEYTYLCNNIVVNLCSLNSMIFMVSNETN